LQYGFKRGSVRGFSWKSGITKLPGRSLTSSPLGQSSSVCLSRVLEEHPTGLNTDPCTVLGLSHSVPAYFNAFLRRTGILTCFPSPTPFGLGLGTASPMGGLSYPRKPWAYGDQISHLVYRYSCLHKLFSGPIPVLTIRRVSTREYSSTASYEARVFGADL
jgi:hypothetical protein